MGGEHSGSSPVDTRNVGSSPRGRGTLQNRVPAVSWQRIIPAWAGNTHHIDAQGEAQSDHPRVGGEHLYAEYFGLKTRGSSPRGRGTHGQHPFAVLVWRIIPAWAGNTTLALADGDGNADHPRVGGEHHIKQLADSTRAGSSPRGRGTPNALRCRAWTYRIIPAWAGNTNQLRNVLAAGSDHPRVGGEHSMVWAEAMMTSGSSPRGRGTLD